MPARREVEAELIEEWLLEQWDLGEEFAPERDVERPPWDLSKRGKERIQAWINEVLDKRAEEEFLARQHGPETDPGIWPPVVLEAMRTKNEAQLIKLVTENPSAAVLLVREYCRGPGHSPTWKYDQDERCWVPNWDDDFSPSRRHADEQIEWVQEIFKRYYRRERGVVTFATEIIVERLERLGLRVDANDLVRYRRRRYKDRRK